MADVSNDLFNKLGKIELSVLSLKPRHQHTVDKKLKEKLRIDSRWQFGIFLISKVHLLFYWLIYGFSWCLGPNLMTMEDSSNNSP